MIPFMPSLYPDELLYSFIGRYHLQSFNISFKDTSEDLFGIRNQLATPDLPTNLVTLNKQLSTYVHIETKDILSKNTFYNYYTNFCSKEKREHVAKAMMSNKLKGSIHNKIGIMASNIKDKQFFHHCKECIKEDIETFGETYWHLTHQLPGVHVCIKHKILLVETPILFRSPSKAMYSLPSDNICIRYKEEFNQKEMFEKLIVIANECISLAKTNYQFNLKDITQNYYSLLKNKGLISSKGTVYQQRLAIQFQSYFGKDLLTLLQCSVNWENASCWLKEITRQHRKTFHPLRHILFILFLDETINSISKTVIDERNPFGKGPYLCLNKAASHYGKPVIKEVEIKQCNITKLNIGYFRCKCGFHYSKIDDSLENPFKIRRVLQFGNVWIEKLKLLVFKDKKSFGQAAKELSVDIKTVKKYAYEQSILLKSCNSLSKKVVLKREEWLNLLKEYPSRGVTTIRNRNPKLYYFLYRNDRLWLKEHSPTETRSYKNIRVDWEARDSEYCKIIEERALDLKEAIPPIRITLNRLCLNRTQTSILQNHINKMPFSKAMLEQVLESTHSFQIRRIDYVVNEMRSEQIDVLKWKVIRRAGLKKPFHEDVMNALNSFF